MNDDDRISGTRTATFHITNIGLGGGDSGTNSILVSNAWGTALFGAFRKDGSYYHCGSGAALDVSGYAIYPLPMPLITEQPQNQMVTNGRLSNST